VLILDLDSSNSRAVAEALEVDCFRKYGKTGRSFYNSQIASTLRWLSSCSLSDIAARVPQHTFVNYEQSLQQETASKASLSESKCSTTSKASMVDDDSLTVSKVEGAVLMTERTSIDRKRMSGDAENSQKSDTGSLPIIPSFSSFMMRKKHKSA
jgi:bloom syndrome protein